MRADGRHASTDHNDVELQPVELTRLALQLGADSPHLVGLKTLIRRLGVEVIDGRLADIHSDHALHKLAERLGHIS